MTGPDHNFTFAGPHYIDGYAPFEVVERSGPNIPDGWYWRLIPEPVVTHGPFPTAEGAYLAARGE